MMKFDIAHSVFLQAQPVLNQLEEAGHEAYFVGGCVRDLLLNRPIHDIDIATSARPEEVESIFKTTIDLGKEHGTIIVVVNHTNYEVTTFRTEGQYTDHRRPDEVSFVRNLREDTLRRDFTINALALDKTGRLYDYHGGMEDLKTSTIRAVGDPPSRFNEDALRMLRALRFASQLGFSIERETMKAIQHHANQLTYIAMERNYVEFEKLITGRYFFQIIDDLIQSGLLDYLPVGLNDNSRVNVALNRLAKNQALYFQAGKPFPPALAWAKLIKGLNGQVSQVRRYMRRWKASNQLINDIIELLQLNDFDNNQLMSPLTVYRANPILLEMVVCDRELHGAYFEGSLDQVRRQLPIAKRQDIVVNGGDLMRLLSLDRGGPLIGSLLEEIEVSIVTGQLKNELESIQQFIHQRIRK